MEIQHKPKQGLCICNCMRGLGFYNLILLFSCFGSPSVCWVVTWRDTRDQSPVWCGTWPWLCFLFQQPWLKSVPVRVSVTSGQWHAVGKEVTRAGGREQPPAEDPHLPNCSQCSHEPQKIIHTSCTAKSSSAPPWKHSYFEVQMFQFNIWPSALPQRLVGASCRSGNIFSAPPEARSDLCFSSPNQHRLRISSEILHTITLFCSLSPDLSLMLLGVTVPPAKADAIITIFQTAVLARPFWLSILGGCHLPVITMWWRAHGKTPLGASPWHSSSQVELCRENCGVFWFSHSQLCPFTLTLSFPLTPTWIFLPSAKGWGCEIQLQPWHEAIVFPNL